MKFTAFVDAAPLGGLSPVPDQNVTVAAGQTVPLSLVDPRTHR